MVVREDDMEPRKYDFVEVTLEPEDYDKVKEVYRLHKEQASKIFNLASGISTDEDIMECIKNLTNIFQKLQLFFLNILFFHHFQKIES